MLEGGRWRVVGGDGRHTLMMNWCARKSPCAKRVLLISLLLLMCCCCRVVVVVVVWFDSDRKRGRVVDVNFSDQNKEQERPITCGCRYVYTRSIN